MCMVRWLLFIVQELVLFGSVLVVVSKNPVYSIVFFGLVVVNLGVCLILLLVEFLAFSFLIVYVGAVCILFLFIVLMLNLRYVEVGGNIVNYFSVCGVVVLLFFVGVFLSLNSDFLLHIVSVTWSRDWVLVVNGFGNISLLGCVLYDYYFFLLLLCGVILFLAMVACIVLTLEVRVLMVSPGIFQQVERVVAVGVRS